MEDLNENYYQDKYVFKTKHYDMSIIKHIALFLLGFIGLQVIASLVSIFLSFIFAKNGIDLSLAIQEFNKYIQGQEGFIQAEVDNYLRYVIILQVVSYILITAACLCSLIKKDFINIFKNFKEKNSWISGFTYGALLMAGTTAISLIINAIRGTIEVNANESMIRVLADNYYIPMFIVTVFCAPLVEEITYRLGVFGVLNKLNKYVAIIVSAIIFALLHFDFTASGDALINELWNLPTYLYSGVILAICYSREGRLTDSIIAHSMNNCISMLIMLIPTGAMM